MEVRSYEKRSSVITNSRVDIELTAGTSAVGLESDKESIGDGGVIAVYRSSVNQIHGNVTKEVVGGRVVDLNDAVIGDRSWRVYRRRASAADRQT